MRKQAIPTMTGSAHLPRCLHHHYDNRQFHQYTFMCEDETCGTSQQHHHQQTKWTYSMHVRILMCSRQVKTTAIRPHLNAILRSHLQTCLHILACTCSSYQRSQVSDGTCIQYQFSRQPPQKFSSNCQCR